MNQISFIGNKDDLMEYLNTLCEQDIQGDLEDKVNDEIYDR
jgi:hypothetical protein